MYRTQYLALTALSLVLGLVVACSGSSTPATPTLPTTPSTPNATLKVSAPVPTSPANNSTFDKGVHAAHLQANAASGQFVATTLDHRFELYRGDALVKTAVVPSSNGTVAMDTGDLDYNASYNWRVRGESGGAAGPWSANASFTTGDVLQPRRNANDYGGKIPASVAVADLNNYLYSVAAQHPGALRSSCLNGRNTLDFPIELLTVLRTQADNRWGFNCRRGNCNDPSNDVVVYHYSPGPSEGSINVYIFDVIGGSACNAQIRDVTKVTFASGTVGKYSLLNGSPFSQGVNFTNILNY